ncbi:hypothetical protein TSOC_003514 [Tetrabaena socialis]|uniref:Uncharacterized protein n=1 Tax=Tetrabaena socialis TaxID=47790 RepID=A0A2J8ABE3_9CHLO|nr:hypothetical protein TSOC_003514 [Tetrabaena socialis]|eukprot:PNH09841.1 hypothetical protein TSOC_003514 [Tetrabaena socialis]
MSPVASRAPPTGSSPSRVPGAARGVATPTKGSPPTPPSSSPGPARTSGYVGASSRGANVVAADDGGAEVAHLRERLEQLAGPGSAAPYASPSASSLVPLSASTNSTASTAIIAAAVAALPANSAAARELRQLQNRLDKATIKANEAFSIRKTYEQVLEKLRLEEPLLEGRIRALQEQRATKKAALQTANISGREVNAGKEAAKATLAALEGDVAAARARRSRILGEMRDKEELRDAASRAEAGSEGLEAALRGYAGVRAGLEHLAAMAAPLPLPTGGPPAVPVEDETLGDVLAQPPRPPTFESKAARIAVRGRCGCAWA